MGFLDKLEKGIERVVTGAFSKTFKSELQPIEIVASIRSQMDANAAIVARDRILVPNQFEVMLSAADYGRLKLISDRLIDELRNQAQAHANKQGFQFAGPLLIKVSQSTELVLGQVSVKSSSPAIAPGDVKWMPRLEVLGDDLVFEIQKPRTTIGRDHSSDVVINDSSLSRIHFEIIWDGKKAGIRDLGSTNGTFVAGVKIGEQALPLDSVIRAGNKTFSFKVVAKAVEH